MYTNSKEQMSLEEAYRRVHLVSESKECGCEGECDCEEKPEKDEKEECDCEGECTCDEKVKEESYLSEGFGSTIEWLTGKLSDLAHSVHGLETKAALYIDQVLGHPELKAAIAKQQELEKSHDMQDIIKAHNMKLDLNELAGEELIRKLHGQGAHQLHRSLKNQLKQTSEEVKRK